MKTSDLLIQCLEKEGVKYIFALPGEEIEDILFSLEKSSIKLIIVRHEQGAAFMANIWGRITGRAGVCLATLGPGATNLITGLADAHLDKSPVVAITGQGSIKRLHKESHQLVDIVNMFKPIVKWNTSIHDTHILSETVRKAFKLAQMEKPGVTHLEIPEDIAGLKTEGTPLVPKILRRSTPDYKAISESLKLLSSAKKPLIIAGNGAIRKLASKHLRLLVEKTGIPVISTFMGKGAISDKNPLSLCAMGLKAKDFPLYAIARSDLILTVGYDIAEYDPALWNPQKKPIVHIDFLPSEVYEYYDPTVEIIADISATLWELNKQLDKRQFKFEQQWFAPIRRAILNDFSQYELDDRHSFTVPGVLAILRRLIHDDDIVISDVGAHKIWIGRNFPVYNPGTCIISNGFASMGIAVPGGIAAKLACPEKNIIAVCGDGGFLMNSQEIETAKRIGVGYTILILNDNDYGLITWKQKTHVQKSFGTAINNPDFKKYAESFGISAFLPKTKKELEIALCHSIQSKEVNIVAVTIDPAENVRLSKKLNSDLSSFII